MNAEPIDNPRRTHRFRPDPTYLGPGACADCLFAESHKVHQLPEAPPDTRYERSNTDDEDE